MTQQTILHGNESYDKLRKLIEASGAKRLLLVCGSSLSQTPTGRFFDSIAKENKIEIFRFNDFTPNPKYEDIAKGVEFFHKNKCDMLCGAGGGSAIDTAKCIKLFANMSDDRDYVEQKIIQNDIPLIAIPTAAGSGSEATHYAVIYYHGQKLSVADRSCLPQIVLLDPENLATLPDRYKKSSMLDALCHAIEALWSVNVTDESRMLSQKAIRTIISSMNDYINGECNSQKKMIQAAFTAGRAIDITATTAGHAMCYKLTTMYGLPHGHAASLCVPEVYRFLTHNINNCINNKGSYYLHSVLEEIPSFLGCEDSESAIHFLSQLPIKLGLGIPNHIKMDDIELLVDSVNPDRLKNTPVIPDKKAIREMYSNILIKR